MSVNAEDTLIGNELILAIGDGNSPEAFVDFCSIGDVAGLGESKPQVDVTTICSTARQFRNGLAEGSEMTIAANFIQGDGQARSLFQSYKDDDIVNFQYRVKGSSPAEYFAWSATVLGWSIAGPVGEKAVMNFTMKITGGVEWVYEGAP
jgi:hypothetical protein